MFRPIRSAKNFVVLNRRPILAATAAATAVVVLTKVRTAQAAKLSVDASL